MKSLQNATSSLSNRNKGKEQQKKKNIGITTVKKKVTTSYNVPPLSLRMSEKDKTDIGDWVDDLQEQTTRNVSSAKLFRALKEMREDIDQEKLLSLINDMP